MFNVTKTKTCWAFLPAGEKINDVKPQAKQDKTHLDNVMLQLKDKDKKAGNQTRDDKNTVFMPGICKDKDIICYLPSISVCYNLLQGQKQNLPDISVCNNLLLLAVPRPA